MPQQTTAHFLHVFCGCIVWFTSIADFSGVAGTNWQLKLWNDLMTDYNKNLKPQLYAHQQLNVDLRPSVYNIESLDEKDQVLTTAGSLTIQWFDHSLKWNPEDYGNINQLIIEGSNIWRPEINLANGVDDATDLSMNDKSRVKIFSFGLVIWGPTFKWKTGCPVNLRYFPYDEQTCTIQFSNWVYGATELNFTVPATANDYSQYLANGEWDLVSNEITNKEEVYTGEGWIFIVPSVEITLALRRKPTYFLVNLVVPSLFMTAMTLLVFCLPPDAGEKMSLGITNLLSYSVMILMVSDVTPRTSDSIPAITFYIIFSMGLSAFALFATTLVLAMHHHCPEKHVPRWIITFILNGIGSLLCVTSCCSQSKLDGSKKWANKVFSTKVPTKAEVQDTQPGSQTLALPSDVVEFVRVLQTEREEKEKEERNTRDWMNVARVVDRFFLVLYCIVIVLSTITLFIILI